MLETLDYTIRIGSTPTFLDFDYSHINLNSRLACWREIIQFMANTIIIIYSILIIPK